MASDVYVIKGTTLGGRIVTSGPCVTIDRARDAFITNAPRFNGKGFITRYKPTVYRTDKGWNVSLKDSEVILNKFNNIKELKEHIEVHV